MTDNGTSASARDETPICQVQAIDVHAHYGDCVVADNEPLTSEFLTASAEEVARRARQAQIEWTVVSPLLGLFPRGSADAAAGTITFSKGGSQGGRNWCRCDQCGRGDGAEAL